MNEHLRFIADKKPQTRSTKGVIQSLFIGAEKPFPKINRVQQEVFNCVVSPCPHELPIERVDQGRQEQDEQELPQ